MSSETQSAENVYDQIVDRIFSDRFRPGLTSLPFQRRDITEAADALGVQRPKNLGDVIYSYRYRRPFPDAIASTAAPGNEWAIVPAGRSVYEFRQLPFTGIFPNPNLIRIKVPDATPGVIGRYSLGDEQALLARVRYNRLIDIFTGLACYSLQNHLRTTIPVYKPIAERDETSQVETDELYVGIGRSGAHYSIPVEAKGADDSHNVIQMWQNVRVSWSKLPGLPVRCVAAQTVRGGGIALIEVQAESWEELAVVNEAHYQLVPSSELTDGELQRYRTLADA